ncbi:hypothetical protein [Neobacillus mesonae]|uniref:hypothetical protein n=1 Tax=Neobacillus mesonae TaxID=1193713 RepID=UPI00203CD67D|nr:hypothetical protein [Neobacillus mesonae]MCM3567145.1 hypothetical protein [Neobacillus mesonae]
MEVIQKQFFIKAMKDKTGSKNPKTVFHPGDEGQNLTRNPKTVFQQENERQNKSRRLRTILHNV